MVKPVVLISIPFCARAALAACKALGMQCALPLWLAAVLSTQIDFNGGRRSKATKSLTFRRAAAAANGGVAQERREGA
jgi:hypothetical protein